MQETGACIYEFSQDVILKGGVPGPAAWSSAGSWLEMQIHRPPPLTPDLLNQKLRVGPRDLWFDKPSR